MNQIVFNSRYSIFSLLAVLGILIFSCETDETSFLTNPGSQGLPGADRPPGWQLLLFNLNDNLNDIFFINGQAGWIVGEGQTLLSTASADIGWSIAPVELPLENLNSVFFINDQVGWVGGDLSANPLMGQVGYSGNGGGYPVQLETFGQPVNTILFQDMNMGWLAGNEGLLAKTINGGKNWEIIPAFTQEKIYDMQFTDHDSGWITAGNGGIFHSEDGLFWELETTGTEADLFAIHIHDQDNGWACGNLNTILRRVNGPEGSSTWEQISIDEAPANMTWKDIFFPDPSTGWVVGNFGLIYKSTDGGLHWTKENSGVLKNFGAIHM
ncbi:MAG: hypothetical protein KFF73_11215, partial [Cyclobacteriaceae bacterium]|nr:hypothetical protein [Cyclobacteriaceae bacterium]